MRDYRRKPERREPTPVVLLVLTGMMWGLIFWWCIAGGMGVLQ